MRRSRQRPFVVATFAMTADGKVTTRILAPVDFTSPQDKLHLFRQRALADAVLLGHTSLKRDNVRLGIPVDLQQARIKRKQIPAPLRVIVSNKGRIDSRLNIFRTTTSPILIFSTRRMPKKTQAALKDKATLYLTEADEIDLAAMLEILRSKYKVRRLACEGGPTLFRALLERGLVDQLNLTIAPYMFGGAKAPTLTGVSEDFLPASVHCSLIHMRTIGDECFLTYRIKHQRRRN
ncbi:MAG TPA: RibD family protein [Candidatus Limnocylindria bacterium]|jgi:2,5-diamino-6-(ribosylamino)-4(3H)-pyrimidinone 5'-phosphate reductase|nr:RibD family protein [Candidatus Limnocylindria bacterium]